MNSPRLSNLPLPLSGKTGWPWTEDIQQVPDTTPDGSPWPRISIVTPSYNQGQFLEETIRSVLLQGYPNLEYIIMDGGSTDDSVEIIKKYEPWLSYWVSQKDDGQADAINKGFQKATGEIMAYINSDDVYLPYSLSLVALLFQQFYGVDWITGHSSFLVDNNVISPRRNHSDAYNDRLMQLGFHVPWLLGIPQQVSTFWKRELFLRAGGYINKDLHIAMDVDLWIRMSRFSAPVFVAATMALMRLHDEQKSSQLGVAFPEIESGCFDFLPLSLRKIIWQGMKHSVSRWIIRRAFFSGKARRIAWNYHDNTWELFDCFAF